MRVLTLWVTLCGLSLPALFVVPASAQYASDDARSMVRASLPSDADGAAQHLRAARAYLAVGEPIKAIAEQTLAIERNPLDAAAYRERAKTWHLKRRYDLAAADFTHALELAPRDVESLYGRALSAHANGDLERAVDDYSAAVRLNPSSSDLYRMRAHARLAQGLYDLAAMDFRRGLDADPKDVSNLVGLAFARFYGGAYKLATDNFARALRLRDDAHASLFLFLARSRQGQPAEEELQRNAGRLASNQWPYPVIELYLGKRSIEDVLGAAQNEVQQCAAQYYVGQWYLLQGNRPDGIAAIKQAMHRCPKAVVEYEAAAADLRRFGQ